MLSFLKSLFASCLGTAIVLFLFIVIPISMLIADSKSEGKTVISDHSVLELKLDGRIVDNQPINPFDKLNLPQLNKISKTGLNNILGSIQRAKTNDNVEGIFLDLGTPEAGFATMEEIRNALTDFKNSGKFVIAYADNYSQKSYYLASCADKVFINPQGMLELKGIAAQRVFFKDLLEKLDVKIQIAKVGTYKSYVEQYSRKDISPESKEQDLVWMNDIWNSISDEIAVSRGISRDDIEKYVKQVSIMQDPAKYLEEKLVDELLYRDQAIGYVNNLCETSDKRFNKITIAEIMDIDNPENTDPIVGVLYCDGDIGGDNGITVQKFRKQIEKLRQNDEVAAIVVRVNSPGGSAYESEQIWREIEITKKKKPVVVSMGDVAASGGYYMSCSADAIVANKTTVTGSIGIFGIMPAFGGLASKVGVNFDVVKTHEYADIPNGIDPLSSSELQQFQAYVERGYKLFTKRCAEGRDMSKKEIEAIAQGMVWSGGQGLDNGLITNIGGIKEAAEIAAKLAKVDNYQTKSYPNRDGYIKDLISSLVGEDIMSSKVLDELKPFLRGVEDLKTMKGVQARLPYQLELN